jgi:hypothetical protein
MKIIKDKEDSCKILCLSYKEFNKLVDKFIGEEKVSFMFHKDLIENIIYKVIDFFEHKGCDFIRFTTRCGERLEGYTYNGLEFDIEYEVNWILDEKYFKEEK